MTNMPFDMVQLVALQVGAAMAAGFVAFKSKNLWQALLLAVVASFVASFVIGFVFGYIGAVQAG